MRNARMFIYTHHLNAVVVVVDDDGIMALYSCAIYVF